MTRHPLWLRRIYRVLKWLSVVTEEDRPDPLCPDCLECNAIRRKRRTP